MRFTLLAKATNASIANGIVQTFKLSPPIIKISPEWTACIRGTKKKKDEPKWKSILVDIVHDFVVSHSAASSIHLDNTDQPNEKQKTSTLGSKNSISN